MPATIGQPRRIDTSLEKKIITGAITNTRYLRNLRGMAQPEYFTLDYSKTIYGWCLKYFEQFGKAPGRHIGDIFDTEKENMSDAAVQLTGTFLERLSDRYVEERRFNVAFMTSRAKRYFRQRSMTIFGEDVLKLISSGKLGRAEQLITDFRQVTKTTSETINFFNPDVLHNINLNPMEEGLFQYSGNMGKIIGPYQRGWLTGILAPMKRGKTWWLMETAFQALEQGLNVLFVSLEMPINDIYLRFARRLTGFYLPTGNQDRHRVSYPVFDCEYNHEGSCNFIRRTNELPFYDDDGEENQEYMSCTYCRDNDHNEEDYVFEPTHVIITDNNPTIMTKLRIRRKIAEFKRMFSSQLFIRCYPAFSATLTDIIHEVEAIEQENDSLIDVIVIDYADILATERHYSDTRSSTDFIWKSLKGLASQKQNLVATASQSTRRSIDMENIRSTDIAEDIRKIAHVDEMFALNQKPSEKREGIMRVGEIAHRHKYFDELKQIYVLQCLSLGQPLLDSEEYYSMSEEDEDEEES